MEQTQPLPNYSLKPGWICIGIATLSMLLLGPFLGSIIAAPLTLAVLVLAIIAMAKNRVAGGVILLILAFVLPPLAFLASMVLSFTLPAPKPSANEGKGKAPTERIEQ